MSLSTLGLAALGLYLAALFVVAEISRRARKDLSPSDHFLAARELGVLVLFLTLYATAYSGNSLLGYPGEAYRRGFSWIMSVGFMTSIIIAFHLLAPRLRPVATQHGFVSPGDWVRHRFADDPGMRRLVLGVAVLMALALANFLFAQLKAMGELADEVTGGVIPYELGVIGLAAMVLFYENRGGMRAVAWTDAAQGLLMLFGLAALLGWLLASSGGFGAITSEIAALRPEAVAVPDGNELRNWISTILLLGLASVVYPQAIQRIYAARSGRTLSRAFSIMTFMPLTTTLVVTLIGIAAIPRFGHLAGVEADRVMPLLLGEWAAAGPLAALAAVAVFIGALAAIMSTADSVLLSFSSLVAEDLLGRERTDENTTRLGKRIAAIVLVAMVALAMDRSITLWRLIELKMELLVQCVPAFILALHWKGLRAGPAFWGLAAGTAVAVTAVFAGSPRLYGFHMGTLSLGLNLLVAVSGSLVVPARSAAQLSESFSSGSGRTG